MKALLCVLIAAGALQAADLPAWWKALPGLSRLESGFVQESDSAVFGKLRKTGTIQLAKGGRLRVTYVKGIVLVSDGTDLVQFDPSAMTAQRLSLRSATKDMPLLNILVDPGALASAYHVRAESEGKVLLEPKRKDLPTVIVEGGNGLLRRVTWTDATGAKQVIELKSPRIPGKAFPASTFTFNVPAGTRWIG